MTNERGLIRFTDGRNEFYIGMQDGGAPKSVAHILKHSNIPLKGWNAAEVATEFLKRHGNTKLIGPWVNYERRNYDFVYEVNTNQVTVHTMKYGYATPLFNGHVDAFYIWADASNRLREAIDKVVKFTYKGGSGTYERLVKLTSVSGEGNATILKGWDVKKSTGEKPAYRTYRIGNIVGNVEIIG